MSDSGLESDVCYHYGSCEYFTIVDVSNKDIENVKAISNLSTESEHNCAAPSIILKSNNVDAVLVAGIGGRPLMSLAEKNIKVFAGITGKVSNAVEDYNNGLLREISMNGTCSCSHH
ncbi:NifB/NifX family molybdenum-iron cluster-binding protein [Methanosarcina sp. UBA5]|uniref:NifB/NifX family molybdenum-iron cluster-binding protein n=1 Tax=Methanosarcina sp. UBA5 TaxID=1915593 RepID=UPI0025D623A3|nr:NifB/NifX family molybdenum-iron cluster-binding protein [Methanosarcina sp. UBA5]